MPELKFSCKTSGVSRHFADRQKLAKSCAIITRIYETSGLETGHKQPISVLVIIHSAALDVLLLERADHPGYWQSVTGSRDDRESLRETARREVFEETGIEAAGPALADWQLQNEYEIYPHWRHRYPPGVTRNTEHVFGLMVPRDVAVRIAPREHLRYVWLPWQEAADKVFSPSNRAAILKLPEMMERQISPP